MIAFACFQQKFSPASSVLLMWFLWDTHRIKKHLAALKSRLQEGQDVKHNTGDQTTEAKRKSGKKSCAFTCRLINIWW